MELLIVMCLLMVILLLISDKIEIRKIVYRKEEPYDSENEPSDMMGKSRSNSSQFFPKKDNKSQNKIQKKDTHNFTEESYTEHKMLQEESEENPIDFPDFEQEEEEFRKLSLNEQNKGLTQGVTLDELGIVRDLLGEENPNHSQREVAVKIVQKIHGTELFSLLENSMEKASEKIAKLLESRVPINKTSGSSTTQPKDIQDFDIGEFV